METKRDQLLRLWKARQVAEGYDVSNVHTLEEAQHFFDKKEEPVKEPTRADKPVSKKKGK